MAISWHEGCLKAVMFLNKKSDSEPGASAVDLQDDVMRFEGRFSSRLSSAFRPLIDESDDATVRLRASRDLLEFMASALDIAVGSSPEVDLLDMMTLVALGRSVVESRWSVDVHGDAGRGINDAFDASLEDIAGIVRAAFSETFEAEVRQVIRTWQRENPGVENVAAVRLSNYAELRDGGALGREAKGLFSFVRGAAQTADTAVLLGERALYAAQRLPFHVRIHAAIATNQALNDLVRQLQGPAIGLQTAKDGSLVGALARHADSLKEEARRSIDRILVRAFLAGSAIAVVASASWLTARLVYRWLER